MTIYVDSLVSWGGNATFPYKRSCHMATDDYSPSGLAALHAFAKRLGLKQAWYQQHPIMPHYDLVPSKRALAVNAGAIELPTDQMIERCRRIPMSKDVSADGTQES